MQRTRPLARIDRPNRLGQITRRSRIDTLAQDLMEQRIQEWCNATHGTLWPN